MRTSRWMVAGVLAGVLSVGVAPSVGASPPANDNFASAEVVSGLPFTDSGELGATTSEPGEPSAACLPSPSQTAWYVMTPATSGSLKVDLTGSDFPVNVVAFRSSGAGFGSLAFVGCGGGFPSATLVFAATAGATYYLQVGVFFPGFPVGHLAMRIDAVNPPANDNFAAAAPLTGAPATATVDLTAATVEPGEPAPGGSALTASAWYTYSSTTTATRLVRANAPFAVLAVYTGASLGGLTVVASGSGSYPPVWFTAQAGTTYHVQVARGTFLPFGFSPVVTLTVDQPGPPSAGFYYYPGDPSMFDTPQFIDTSFDLAYIGFGPRQWDLGDGSTATGCCPAHRYAADGDYVVTYTVTTLDGRTATAVKTVSVRTHDVSIDRIQAPNSARVGQVRSIGVSLKGGRYPESVQVDLLKSVAGGGEHLVGTQTVAVPVGKGGRTAGVDFSYTFTADDGTTGKVTFRAVASLVGARDALPADNQAISAPVEVKR